MSSMNQGTEGAENKLGNWTFPGVWWNLLEFKDFYIDMY